MVRERLDEIDLLESATNKILRDAVKEMIGDEKLIVMGVPQITITKLAPKNPVTFAVRFALFPSITLPDYKKIGHTISERKDSIEVTDAEVEQGVEQVKKMMNPPPPINDEFRVELKKELIREKEMAAKDKKREEIIAEIMKASKMKVPDLLIEQELYGFIERRDAELKNAGLSLDAYLKQIGRTAEELEKQERTLIEDQIKMSLALEEIRKKENVAADENEIHAHIPYLKMRYPDRDESSLHETARAFVIQEKLFAILEGATAKPVAAPQVEAKNEI
jgi:FKBP-type peptidyl-prolyl cis-trans isomerase (trigger factor)